MASQEHIAEQLKVLLSEDLKVQRCAPLRWLECEFKLFSEAANDHPCQ